MQSIECKIYRQTLAADWVGGTVYSVGLQSRDPILYPLAVDGNNLVSNLKRVGLRRQIGPVDAVDENLAIVNVYAEVGPGLKVGRQGEFVVAILESGNVADAYIIKLQVAFGLLDLVQPGLDGVQIEADHVTLPFVGGVILGVEARELHEIGDLLIRRQLPEGLGNSGAYQHCREAEIPHERAPFEMIIQIPCPGGIAARRSRWRLRAARRHCGKTG